MKFLQNIIDKYERRKKLIQNNKTLEYEQALFKLKQQINEANIATEHLNSQYNKIFLEYCQELADSLYIKLEHNEIDKDTYIEGLNIINKLADLPIKLVSAKQIAEEQYQYILDEMNEMKKKEGEYNGK